jgi:transcriptional regulator GlxA family with amidase domain
MHFEEKMNVGIYIYNQAEVLDFSGPFEVFSTASRVCEGSEPFNVFLVSQSGETITARAGYKVIPDFGFDNHPEIDVLMVVGGVHADELKKSEVLEWIFLQSKKAKIVASVCTGTFLLAKAKVLQTEKVTTHWDDIQDFRKMFPTLEVIEDVRWVDEGAIITSGGISAGIDMSLHLVAKLYGSALAEKTARQMAYSWTKNS